MTAVEHDYKFTASQSAIAELSIMYHQTGVRNLSQLISKKLATEGYIIEQPSKIEYQDTYYDTDDKYLVTNKAFLRVRSHPEKTKVTFKLIIGSEGEGLIRITESKKSQQVDIDLLNESGQNNIVTRLLPDIGNRKLHIILKSSLSKIKYAVKKQELKYCISIDLYRFQDPYNKQLSDEHLEIELKATNGVGKENIKEFITCFFSRLHGVLRGLKPSSGTKYLQGLQHLKEIEKRDFLDNLLISNNNLAFIIMKFGDENLDSAYEIIIKPAFSDAGYNPVRIDEVQDSGRITDQVLIAIKNASVILADLTGERPNCYYECGYAHANGKNLILSIKKGEDIHFDLKDHRFIVWRTEVELKRCLVARLEALKQARTLKA